MVLTPSTMLALGTQAPGFALPDATGKWISLSDFADAPTTVVVFMCNHCPYVKHLKKALASFVREYQARQVAVIGINSNDIGAYPDDHPKQMMKDAMEFGLHLPVPRRRDAGGGQSLPCRVHTRFLCFRSGLEASLPRSV